jgi:hypothetical protein
MKLYRLVGLSGLLLLSLANATFAENKATIAADKCLLDANVARASCTRPAKYKVSTNRLTGEVNATCECKGISNASVAPGSTIKVQLNEQCKVSTGNANVNLSGYAKLSADRRNLVVKCTGFIPLNF